MQNKLRRRTLTATGLQALALGACLMGNAFAQETALGVEAIDDEISDEVAESLSDNGGWTTRITVEGLVLKRDGAAARPLTKAGDTTAPIDPFVPFNSSALKFDDASSGVRLTAEMEINGLPIEVSGFFLSPIQGRAAIEGLNAGSNDTDAIYTNRDFPGGDNFFRYSEDIYGMIIEQQTDLMGAEANLRDAFGLPGLLIGARAIFLSEKFSSSTHDRFADFPPNGGERIDGLSIRSDNLLAGLQIGYQGMIDITPGISIGGSAKAGVYANFADVESTFTTLSVSGAVPSRSRVLKDGDDVFAATAIELNPRIDWRINDGVVLTAAGTFLWINNLSEAVSYFGDAANASRFNISDNGDAFFYGGSLGLRFEMEKLGAYFANASRGGVKDAAPSHASLEEVEERVAELEATAATKGNRAVSVNITGQVNKMLMWWNDGELKDVYIADNTTSGTRFGIDGEARISRALKAGYNINLRVNDARSIDLSQIDDDGEEGVLETRFAEFWLQHNLYGRLTIGQTSPATDEVINANLGGTSGVTSADIALIGGAMRLRRRNTPFENLLGPVESTRGTTMRSFVRDLDTPRRDGVRWDSEQYYGFVASAFWGENDFWDVAVTYARSFSDWRVRLRVGYLEDSDGGDIPGDTLITEFKGSGALLHVPTGLFANAAYIHREFDGDSSLVRQGEQIGNNNVLQIASTPFADFNYYYAQGGIRQKWSGLGETSIFGEYAEAHDGLTGRDVGGFDRVTDSKLTMIGGGIVQKIDSADMEIYGGLRYFKYDIDGIEGGRNTPPPLPKDAEAYEDLGIVYTGTRVKF